MPDLTIRPAALPDAALVLTLLRRLAAYEKLLDKFTLTEAQIARDFFGPDRVIGCDLAFEGRGPGRHRHLVLDLCHFPGQQEPVCRGPFCAAAMARQAAMARRCCNIWRRKALANGAARMEWLVLDWNAPAIAFYNSIGARPRKAGTPIGWKAMR